MSKSVYSFGEESPLKFVITDKLARYYNEATAQYYKAQQRFNQKYGRTWDPLTDPIKVKWNRRQKWAWNEFAKVLAKSVENDGSYSPNEIMDDFLVKNTLQVVTLRSRSWGRVIAFTVGGAVLYGVLRGK